MSKTEKMILIYLAAGLAVRLAKFSISPRINTETFVGTVILWPVALLSGYSSTPLTPPPVNNETNPVEQNAGQ